MALPNLDDLTGALDRACMDGLGSLIQYKAAVAPTYAAVRAHADYRDKAKAFEAAQVIEQDMTFSVLMDDVPAKPAPAVRIQLAKVPGKTFRPENVRRDESCTHWEFELREVAVA